MNKLFGKVKEQLKQGHGDGQSHSSRPPTNIRFPLNQPDDPKPVWPQPGQQAPGPGQMPPKAKSSNFTERHQFYDPSGRMHHTMRDLGFSGVLDGRIVWTWGDTLMGEGDKAHICAVDSTTIGSMANPMHSIDSKLQGNSCNVDNLIPCNQTEHSNGGYGCFSFGGTNIVEIGPNKGLVYYLKNHRPGGKDKIKGAGVATVEISGDGQPHANRPHDTMWLDCEPAWGDIGVTFNAQDGHVYAFGNGASTDMQELFTRCYLCRVPADKALDISAYEYWNNGAREWTKQRFANGQMGTLQNTKEQAIFDWRSMGQSTPFWSNYFNKWMFLHATGWPASDVICHTADKLEGPWQDHGPVATLNGAPGKPDGMKYCVTGHPQFDPSGKTVLVTWTNSNEIYGLTLEWE